ncbi:OmpA family protein [Granulicella paludicola]|uniref:hypothetical protein n=1 Tax=Granulicella paludicola TaxID=474951 RepID=UPI0021DFEEA6|nr:hypothetical protein [Granulicella paludicola]
MAIGVLCASAYPSLAQAHSKPKPPNGVEEVCSIAFDQDAIRPARLENGALPCLKEAARKLKERTDRKLVLVGVKDPSKDHELAENGSMREEEDATGLDVRLEDLSAYRAVNTKWYLVRYLGVDPTRVIPVTDESYFAQTVTAYLVPASADYNHNFLGATKTNEKPCTITPCYSPDEETLTAQRRSRIPENSAGQPLPETHADQLELAALQRRRAASAKQTAKEKNSEPPLTPLPARPTPEHPATTSIIP